MGEVRMGGYELMLLVKGDASGATAEIVKTKNALDDMNKSVTTLNKTNALNVAQTYEISKATRQLSLGLSSLSFVPVIGNFAAMGTQVAFTAGGIKNLTAGIKTFGKVSLPIIGSLAGGVEALAALITGFGAGVLLDKIFKINKVTAIGAITEMIEVRNMMKSIAEQSEFVGKREEEDYKKLANLGVYRGATWAQTMKYYNEMVAAGEIVRNKELQKDMTKAQMAEWVAQKQKEANIKAMEAERETLSNQLSNVRVYYSGLEKLHNDYIEKSKAKSQELIDLENSIRTSQLETSNIVNSIRQKSMSAADAYYDKVKQLEDAEFQAWMMKPGTEKIDALKNAQQAWSNLTDEIKDGENVIISASDAQARAINKVKEIGAQLGYAFDDQKKIIEEQKAAYDATASSIATAMQAAQASIININTQIAQLDFSLAKEKNLNINVNQAFDNIKKVREMMDAIPDVTTKKLIIETYTKSSPAVPFSEGIKNMTDALNSLPTGSNYTIDMSSLTGLIEQYKVLGSLYAATSSSVMAARAYGGWGPAARAGAAASYASIESSQKMIETLFNVGMIQAFANIYSQLEGHEKIDSKLQSLIEGYLGNISSFQGLTSPIEFQKPSFIHVDPGERLYPAGDSNSYSIHFSSPITINKDVKDGRNLAEQYEEEMADRIRTGRSKIIKEIKRKLSKN
jgi:hypothetical protein